MGEFLPLNYAMTRDIIDCVRMSLQGPLCTRCDEIHSWHVTVVVLTYRSGSRTYKRCTKCSGGGASQQVDVGLDAQG
jgi:hypothetical protein